MGIFVYASTATGKSTCAKKYKNVIDMESTKYKYLDQNAEDESAKSTKSRTLNPAWPKNYFDALKEVKDKYDYILIADEICNSFLLENKLEYWWVYPNLELKREYLNRCKNRGNNRKFIKFYKKNWKNWYFLCKNDKNASKHIELKHGEFLESVLPNLEKKQ